MIKAIISDIQGVLVDTADGFDINTELIEFLIKNKKDYGLLLLYSNLGVQSVESVKKIVPKLFDHVDGEYYASNVKYIKPDVRGFKEILNIWGLEPSEVIFIDDNQSNIKAAESLGIGVVHYEDLGDISTLNSLLYP